MTRGYVIVARSGFNVGAKWTNGLTLKIDLFSVNRNIEVFK